MQNEQSNNKFFILAGFLVLLDQATKLAVKGFDLLGIHHEGLDYGQMIPVIGDFLQFTYIENEGMAFGISFGWGKIFLSLFSLFASIALFIIIKRLVTTHKGVIVGLTLVLAGAFGNLIDRMFYGVFYGESPLFYGRVVDFIQVDIPDINLFGIYYSHFPVFNIADSCVTCGVVTLLIFNKYLPTSDQIFKKKKNHEQDDISLTSQQNINES